MASAVKRDARAVVTTCGDAMPIAPLHVDGRVVAELPVPGIRARRVPLCPRAASPGNAVDERDRICIPCADELMARVRCDFVG
ncbi:MAG: hypothetical protein ACLTXI_04215 [Collinsella sp.]